MAKRNKNLQQFAEIACYELAIMDSSDEDEEERIFNELEENASIFVGHIAFAAMSRKVSTGTMKFYRIWMICVSEFF